MTIKLFDLPGTEPDSRVQFSPYCWRSKLALANKGVAVETMPWRFVEKEAIAMSRRGRVPVLLALQECGDPRSEGRAQSNA